MSLIQEGKNKIKSFCVFFVFITTLSLVACTSESGTTGIFSNDNSSANQETKKEEILLYSDDNFNITFVDFKDPNVGVTSYNLYLKIENNSDKTVIVSPSDGYANDEAVFLGSGMPVKVAPNKNITGVFVVGYGNTSIQSIDEIKTLELKLTLYDENWSEELLQTENLTITFE